MNIAIIACVVLFACAFAYMLRKNEVSKPNIYTLIAIAVVFEVLFAIYHPILWIIQAFAFVLAISYYYICTNTTSVVVIPYLFFMYAFLLTASGSILIVIAEAIFGKFF